MAAELRLMQKDEARQVFPLPQGVLTIGRDPTNHIQLDSPAVHARHARIFTVGDSSVIQDIVGSSGIFVNDDEIVHRKLCNEDIIHIGSHRLLFVNPAAPAQYPAAAAGPEPAAGEIRAPRPVDDDEDAVEAPAASPVQSDEPPFEAAAAAETDADAGTAQQVATPVTAAAPGTATSATEASEHHASVPDGNVYPYPAPRALHASADQGQELAGAQSVPFSEPSPLTLVTDNEALGTSGQPDNAASVSSISRTQDSPEELDSVGGEAGSERPATAPQAAFTKNAEGVPPAEDEPITALPPTQPTAQGWETSHPGEDDYPPLSGDGTAAGQVEALPEAAPMASGPAPNSAPTDDPSPPPLPDGATAQLADAAPSSEELVDFPPFTAGIEVLNGPNEGKRLMFSRPRIVLGKNGGRSVIIERHGNEYRVHSADRGTAATLNGTLLLQEPMPLADGDHIEFAELSTRFFQRSSTSE